MHIVCRISFRGSRRSWLRPRESGFEASAKLLDRPADRRRGGLPDFRLFLDPEELHCLQGRHRSTG